MQSNRTKLNEELHLCFVFWERKPILLLNLEELRRIILWQWVENQAAASWKLVPWFFNETKFDLYLFVCLTLGSNHLVSLWTYWKIKNANEPRKIRPSNFFSKIVCHRLIMSTADDQALIQNVLLFFSSIFQIKSSCVGKGGHYFSCLHALIGSWNSKCLWKVQIIYSYYLFIIRYLYLLKIISGENTCPKSLQSNWNY